VFPHQAAVEVANSALHMALNAQALHGTPVLLESRRVFPDWQTRLAAQRRTHERTDWRRYYADMYNWWIAVNVPDFPEDLVRTIPWLGLAA
jgi:hypothetical protein